MAWRLREKDARLTVDLEQIVAKLISDRRHPVEYAVTVMMRF